MSEFTLRNWCAFAPGLDYPSDKLVSVDGSAALASVPKLMQRRLSPLAKAVFAVAHHCLADTNGKELPVVFSSAHGEICKSLELLQTIQAGEALSPTAFSLSVHNAIAGLFSIAFGIHEEITVLAPCREGIAAAFVEGLGLLQEGADEVLLLFYDEPIAQFYPTAPFRLNANDSCVLGLRLGLGIDQGHPMKLSWAVGRARRRRATGTIVALYPLLVV